MTTIYDVLKKQLDFLNVFKYHEQGFTGKGITVLNTEDNIDHGAMTTNSLLDFAPDANVINSPIIAKVSNSKVEYCRITINDSAYELEDAIDVFKIKLITTSLSGSTSNVILNYFKDLQQRKGVIMFNAAGNESSFGATGKYIKNDTAIAIGACVINDDCTVSLTRYSAIDDEVDFVFPTGRFLGTSASSPNLTGAVACLLNKYGDFTQQECVEILKIIAMDLGEQGKDRKFGWGLPILPLTDELEVLNKLDFKDISNDRWSKPAIDRCVNEGLLLGFPDGTFRPTDHVTREQFAQILVRVLDKINK